MKKLIIFSTLFCCVLAASAQTPAQNKAKLLKAYEAVISYPPKSNQPLFRQS